MSAHASPAAESSQNGFTQVPNSILKANHLSFGARTLYGVLLSYCYHKDYCYPSYETLMRDLGCHSQALRKYITELIKHGYIIVERNAKGGTNRYILTQRVTTDTPTAGTAPEAAAQQHTLKITEDPLRKSQTEEYIEKEYIYPSSTRKTENSGESYVKFDGIAAEPQDSTTTPHQTRVEQYRNDSSTTARNIEEIEPQKNITPAPRQTRLEHENGLTLYEDIQRGLLLEYMSDFASEFNDQAPIQSSITRAYHLLQQSGLTMEAFTTYLYTARAVTKERTASIRKYTNTGVKTKMAYFFAVLEDRLGLRQKPFQTLSQTP